MSRKALETKARKLAAKFVADAQALFDDDGMTDAINDGDVFQALLTAQQDAEEVEEAGK